MRRTLVLVTIIGLFMVMGSTVMAGEMEGQAPWGDIKVQYDYRVKDTCGDFEVRTKMNDNGYGLNVSTPKSCQSIEVVFFNRGSSYDSMHTKMVWKIPERDGGYGFFAYCGYSWDTAKIYFVK